MDSQGFEIVFFDQIGEVPEEHVSRLLGQCSVTLSHKFWTTLESSNLGDISYRYIVVYQRKEPVAFFPICRIKTDIAIFSPRGLKNLLATIRRIFPGFLMVNMLEFGSPVTINTPQFIIRDDIDKDRLFAELNLIVKRDRFCKRCFLTILRDFEDNHDVDSYRQSLSRLGFQWLPTMPNTYLDVKWSSLDEYHAAMRSDYRHKLFKHLKRSKLSGISHELVDDFSALADELCRQWLVVHAGATELKREKLTAEFYAGLSKSMGSDSKALLFYKDCKLIAHVLLLRDGKLLRWLYVGRNRSQKDSLYYYMIHKIVETAFDMGVERIEMGLTTYPIKQDFGAQLVPINIAIRLNRSPFNALLTPIYKLLHASSQYPDKRVFKVVRDGISPETFGQEEIRS